MGPDFLPFVQNGGSFDLGNDEENYPPLGKPELTVFTACDSQPDKDAIVRQRLITYWTAIIENHIMILLNTISIAVLGRTGAGKTTFAKSLIAGVPTHALDTTIGFETPVELKLNDPTETNTKLTFNIIDLGG